LTIPDSQNTDFHVAFMELKFMDFLLFFPIH